MIAYADSTGCYRAALLGYFGEADAPTRCQACGNCQRRRPVDPDQLTLLRKMLSGVARGGERWGRRKIAAMLHGDVEELPASLGGLSTTGILRDESRATLDDWLEAAIGAGLLRVSDDRYRLLALTPAGRDVLQGRSEDVAVTLPARASTRPGATGRRTRRRRPAASPAEGAPDVDDDLLSALKRWRMHIARARSVPPYVVLHDRTLRELASRKPTTIDALADIAGIGPAKLSSYGPVLLRIVGGLRDEATS
jgi:ATP-dependent DNA helicase RecQ